MGGFRRRDSTPVSPALVKAEPMTKVEPETRPPEVLIGKPAPTGDLPTVDGETLNRLIKEQVEAEVKDRLKALELDDPSKADMRPDEDQQFGNFDKKLEVFGVDLKKALPGFHLHWFNDVGDRILRMQVLGYTFVKRTEVALNDKVAPLNQDLGENIAVYAGTQEGGGALRAVLMKIPDELYEKRYNRAQEHNDAIEESIKRGSIGNALQHGGYPGTDQGQVKISYDPRQQRVVPRRRAP